MANKKLHFFIMTLFACVALFGCNNDKDEEPTGTGRSPYFVQTYIAADDFELKDVEWNGNYSVGIYFKGERISITWPQADTVRFKELAEIIGDGSYTGRVIPDANKALVDALTSVSVVCNKEYDTEHGAGSSLGDLVLFCATSPYDFIQGGYKDAVKEYPDYWGGIVMRQGVGYKPVEMSVSAVNKDNSFMLYPVCQLYFKKRPAHGGEYVFTVTVKMRDSEIVKKIVHRF